MRRRVAYSECLHGSRRHQMAAARCRRNVARCGRVVARHDLDQGGIAEAAARYEARAGVDFNSAPWLDFKDAPLGQNLGELVHSLPAFDPFRDKFNDALAALDYRTADGVIDRCLKKGIIVDPAGRDVYDDWRRHAELLEGLNVALFRASGSIGRLLRFIADLGELDNTCTGGGAWQVTHRTGCRRRRGRQTICSGRRLSPGCRTLRLPSVAGCSPSATRHIRAPLMRGASGLATKRAATLQARAKFTSMCAARSRRASILI